MEQANWASGPVRAHGNNPIGKRATSSKDQPFVRHRDSGPTQESTWHLPGQPDLATWEDSSRPSSANSTTEISQCPSLRLPDSSLRRALFSRPDRRADAAETCGSAGQRRRGGLRETKSRCAVFTRAGRVGNSMLEISSLRLAPLPPRDHAARPRAANQIGRLGQLPHRVPSSHSTRFPWRPSRFCGLADTHPHAHTRRERDKQENHRRPLHTSTRARKPPNPCGCSWISGFVFPGGTWVPGLDPTVEGSLGGNLYSFALPCTVDGVGQATHKSIKGLGPRYFFTSRRN